MRHIIIGNGVAGVTAAQAIRAADDSAEIHILSAEPYLYYYRPRLWELISGKSEEEAIYFRPESFYKEKRIQVHLGVAAAALDPKAHTVRLPDGERMTYDRALLAMGGHSFVPPVEGADQKGVFTLRTLEDARALMGYADQVDSAAIIGGGLLGLETAHSLKTRGLKKVTVIEFMPHLLPRQLDPPGAAVLQALLEELGLAFITDGATQAIRQENGSLACHLKDGRAVRGGLVLFSTGIRSNVALAKESGIEVDRSVVIDDYLRASAEDVFAAGDVAQYQGVTYGIIPAAIEQGKAAGANMVDEKSAPYNGTIPNNRLKVVGINLISIGEATAEEEDGVSIIRRQDDSGGQYQRVTLRDGKVTGAILIGSAENFLPLKRLIDSGQDVSAYQERLLDEGFDLKALSQGKPVE